MTDQPNLKQFLDELSNYSETDGAGAASSADKPLLRRSARCWRSPARDRRIVMDARPADRCCQAHADPSIAMSGQVGSQVKMKVGTSWLVANVRTLRAGDETARSSPTSTSSAKAASVATAA